MGEFFIAFFGGIFLLLQHIVKTSKKERVDREWHGKHDSANAYAKMLKPTIDDVNAVRTIMDTYSAEDLADILDEDLTEVFGEDFRELIPLNKKQFREFLRGWSPYSDIKGRSEFRCYSYISYWIRIILLSKRGKVGSDSVREGILVGVGDPDVDFAMCKRVEKNLASAGVEIHLGIETEDAANYHRVYAVEQKPVGWKCAELEAIYDMQCRGKSRFRAGIEHKFENSFGWY